MSLKDPTEELENLKEPQDSGGTDGPGAGWSPKKGAETQGATDRVGRVVAVSGSQVIMLLELPEGVPALGEDDDDNPLQIGALVKMHTTETTVFGMVCGLSIPIPGETAESREMRIVELELVGEARNCGDQGG